MNILIGTVLFGSLIYVIADDPKFPPNDGTEHYDVISDIIKHFLSLDPKPKTEDGNEAFKKNLLSTFTIDFIIKPRVDSEQIPENKNIKWRVRANGAVGDSINKTYVVMNDTDDNDSIGLRTRPSYSLSSSTNRLYDPIGSVSSLDTPLSQLYSYDPSYEPYDSDVASSWDSYTPIERDEILSKFYEQYPSAAINLDVDGNSTVLSEAVRNGSGNQKTIDEYFNKKIQDTKDDMKKFEVMKTTYMNNLNDDLDNLKEIGGYDDAFGIWKKIEKSTGNLDDGNFNGTAVGGGSGNFQVMKIPNDSNRYGSIVGNDSKTNGSNLFESNSSHVSDSSSHPPNKDDSKDARRNTDSSNTKISNDNLIETDIKTLNVSDYPNDQTMDHRKNVLKIDSPMGQIVNPTMDHKDGSVNTDIFKRLKTPNDLENEESVYNSMKKKTVRVDPKDKSIRSSDKPIDDSFQIDTRPSQNRLIDSEKDTVASVSNDLKEHIREFIEKSGDSFIKSYIETSTIPNELWDYIKYMTNGQMDDSIKKSDEVSSRMWPTPMHFGQLPSLFKPGTRRSGISSYNRRIGSGVSNGIRNSNGPTSVPHRRSMIPDVNHLSPPLVFPPLQSDFIPFVNPEHFLPFDVIDRLKQNLMNYQMDDGIKSPIPLNSDPFRYVPLESKQDFIPDVVVSKTIELNLDPFVTDRPIDAEQKLNTSKSGSSEWDSGELNSSELDSVESVEWDLKKLEDLDGKSNGTDGVGSDSKSSAKPVYDDPLGLVMKLFPRSCVKKDTTSYCKFEEHQVKAMGFLDRLMKRVVKDKKLLEG